MTNKYWEREWAEGASKKDLIRVLRIRLERLNRDIDMIANLKEDIVAGRKTIAIIRKELRRREQ